MYWNLQIKENIFADLEYIIHQRIDKFVPYIIYPVRNKKGKMKDTFEEKP